MSGFVLLASYPKSGSTWLRAVLESLRAGGTAIDINANPCGTLQASDRKTFDDVMGVDAASLPPWQVVASRPQVWRLVAHGDGPLPWIKIHDALLPPLTGLDPAFPTELIAAAVYIVRDPRDVVVSFAHHFGVAIDAALEWMADPLAFLDGTTQAGTKQLPQLLSSWSRHVESWLDARDVPIITVRYEDMHADAASVFGGVARHLGLTAPAETLEKAVAATQFKTLRAQEDREGFAEREPSMDRFFRQGTAGGWRDVLTPEQTARIARDHGAVMQRLGYPV